MLAGAINPNTNIFHQARLLIAKSQRLIRTGIIVTLIENRLISIIIAGPVPAVMQLPSNLRNIHAIPKVIIGGNIMHVAIFIKVAFEDIVNLLL